MFQKFSIPNKELYDNFWTLIIELNKFNKVDLITHLV